MEEEVLSLSAHEESAPALTFAQDEAALEAYYLEKKQKKLSLRERLLLSAPDFAKTTPKIDLGQGADQFIDFDDEDKVKNAHLMEEKGITELMDRLVEQEPCNSEKIKKPHHYKIHVDHDEKDSEGILHFVTDEFDYVNMTHEEVEEGDLMTQVRASQGSSHIKQVPGEKLYKLKNFIKGRIRDKKVNEYEEKLENKAEDNELSEDEEEDEEI